MLEDVQVLNVISMPLAHAIFSEDTYGEDETFLKSEVKVFINTSCLDLA